jgi:hypothetical protein
MAVLLFLILLTLPGWSQQSSEASSAYTRYFTEQEWAALEVEILAELERTALEAAEEAVEPHIRYEAELEAELAAETCRKKAWRATGIAALIAALIATLVAVLR